MKVKVNESEGKVLDYLVTKCADVPFPVVYDERGETVEVSPSTNWAQGGAIIEREGISLECDEFARWHANGGWSSDTPLLSAMRCYVAIKMGDEVDVPDELV